MRELNFGSLSVLSRICAVWFVVPISDQLFPASRSSVSIVPTRSPRLRTSLTVPLPPRMFPRSTLDQLPSTPPSTTPATARSSWREVRPSKIVLPSLAGHGRRVSHGEKREGTVGEIEGHPQPTNSLGRRHNRPRPTKTLISRGEKGTVNLLNYDIVAIYLIVVCLVFGKLFS